MTDADAWRIALAHDDDAPRRVLRFLLGIRLGESRLVGGSGNPVSTAYVRNVRGYLSLMFASARVGLFDGAKLYSNCASASAAYTAKQDGGEFVGCPIIDGRVTASLAGMAKIAVANGEFQERQRPVDPALMYAIYTRGIASLAVVSGEGGAAVLASSARLMVNCFLCSMAWGTMLRPENLLAVRSKDVSVAPPSPVNDAIFMEYGHPRYITVQYTMVKTNLEGAKGLPEWRFYSMYDVSNEAVGRPMSTQCVEEWNNIPSLFETAQACVDEVVGANADGSRHPFLALARPRQQGAAAGAVAFSLAPLTHEGFQEAFESDISAVQPQLSLEDFGGLYAFRRGSTQYWLEKLGDVEKVMQMGMWSPESPRFLRYLINIDCRGTLRTSLKRYMGTDEAQLRARIFRAYELHFTAVEEEAEHAVDGGTVNVCQVHEHRRECLWLLIKAELEAHCGRAPL